MTTKASDLAARLQASATHSHREPAIAPAPTSTTAPSPTRRQGAPARFTVELPRQQHRFVKRFALDADTDASSVTRALFTLLESDPVLAERVRTMVAP